MGNKKFFIASFNRASNGALEKFKKALDKKFMLMHGVYNGRDWFTEKLLGTPPDFIIAPGDRKETFDFCLRWYGKIPIIHLWAGEVSQGTHDEIYRWAITNMSMMQLCTNQKAKDRVVMFFSAIGRFEQANAHVVGNVMLDNMPDSFEYDVVLYNPPTLQTEGWMVSECEQIKNILDENYFWIISNGDSGSHVVDSYANTPNLPRNQFLCLLKNCNRFITNSSSADYEAKHIIPEERIVRVGKRNEQRESQTEDMTIPNATENIIKILEGL